MLTLYFSGTGNTKFLAEAFSKRMNAKCYSIEEAADFATEITAHDTIAFCYPIYGSRVPRIMREFAHTHMAQIIGKKIIILVTQMVFSGDGARVFTDLFPKGAVEVIYAEHFNMQQNMGNIPVLNLIKPSDRFYKKVEAKLNKVCENIKNGIIKKRGFAKGSLLLGYIQGKPWQKDTSEIPATRMEKAVKDGLRVNKDCNACNLCTKICPMKNLVNDNGQIKHQSNCTVCYRCVNRCPQKAITVYIHTKPRWQFTAK
ncbi:MAG: EFR1 family ferrodoxin [Defluviitaleaceae bacterium]|nr:EFR1 family ferrodoxin [Defluviitaleaceae bacterium]